MAIGGGIAGLAGMVEVSAIQGRLVGEISPGYGYMGFLVAWLAGPSALRIVAMAFLFAFVSSVGDILQITQSVPFSVVNILMSAILFSVLCGGGRNRGNK
jgi:simple sugar transport system permease protein